jgi:hypothetical protein
MLPAAGAGRLLAGTGAVAGVQTGLLIIITACLLFTHIVRVVLLLLLLLLELFALLLPCLGCCLQPLLFLLLLLLLLLLFAARLLLWRFVLITTLPAISLVTTVTGCVSGDHVCVRVTAVSLLLLL